MARKHAHPQQMKVQDIQKKLGNKLYIFPASSTSHRCMITAHGGYWVGTSKFKVPSGVTLYFYTQHVVTIRNRWYSSGVSLSYLIKKVRAAYPDVTEFHCSHCRSKMSLF